MNLIFTRGGSIFYHFANFGSKVPPDSHHGLIFCTRSGIAPGRVICPSNYIIITAIYLHFWTFGHFKRTKNDFLKQQAINFPFCCLITLPDI